MTSEEGPPPGIGVHSGAGATRLPRSRDASDGRAVLVAPAVLPPYTFFTGTAPDLRTAKPREVDAAMLEIVRVEGPVVGTRAMKAYVNAMGAQDVSARRRKILRSSLARLVRTKNLTSEAPLGETSREQRTFRLPDQPRANPRRRDDRPIGLIAPLDIIAVMEAIHRDDPNLHGEQLRVATRHRLGFGRMGSDVRERIQDCQDARERLMMTP